MEENEVKEEVKVEEVKVEKKDKKSSPWLPLTLAIISSVLACVGFPMVCLSIAALVISAIGLSKVVKSRKDGTEVVHQTASFVLLVFAVTLSSVGIVAGIVMISTVVRVSSYLSSVLALLKMFMYL